MTTFDALQKKLIAFRDERDWKQFHTPKNLAIDIAVEAGELLEHFQWLTDEQVKDLLSSDKKEAVQDELADVLMGCILFADILNINILDALNKKIDKTAQKYPVEKVRGSTKKYTEY